MPWILIRRARKMRRMRQREWPESWLWGLWCGWPERTFSAPSWGRVGHESIFADPIQSKISCN